MPNSGNNTIKSYAAAAAYAANTLVYLSAADTATQLADTSLAPLGVLMEASSATGDRCDVCQPSTGSIVEITAGNTVTAGKLVQATTGGKVLNATSDNVWVIGTALNDGSSGSIVNVLWLPHVTNDVSALGGN